MANRCTGGKKKRMEKRKIFVFQSTEQPETEQSLQPKPPLVQLSSKRSGVDEFSKPKCG